jgi:hypothetical protein
MRTLIGSGVTTETERKARISEYWSGLFCFPSWSISVGKFIKVVGIKQVCGKPSAGATVRIAASSIAAVVRFDPADISIMLNGGHVIDAAKNGNQAILDYASSKPSSPSTF